MLVLAAVLFMLATGVGGQGEVLNGMFVRDTAADVMKVVIVLVTGMTLVYGFSYLRERNLFQGEIAVRVADQLARGVSRDDIARLVAMRVVSTDPKTYPLASSGPQQGF